MSEQPEQFDPPGPGPDALEPDEYPTIELLIPVRVTVDATAARNQYDAYLDERREATDAGLELDEPELSFHEWALEYAVSWLADGPVLEAELNRPAAAALEQAAAALDEWEAGHPHTKSVWTERLGGALAGLIRPPVELEEPSA